MTVPIATPEGPTIEPVAPPPRSDAARGPRLSVVVAWRTDEQRLSVLLSRRLDTLRERGIDMIVVTRDVVSDLTAARCPGIRFLSAPADVTVGRMRELGIRHATGDVVMLVDNFFDEEIVDSICAGWTADGACRL